MNKDDTALWVIAIFFATMLLFICRIATALESIARHFSP